MTDSAPTSPSCGRPSLCSPELLELIFLTIRTHGVCDSDAATLAGLSPSTLSRWKQEQPTLRLALQQARLQFQQDRLAAIREACDAQGRKPWRAQAWLLAQAFPELYGRRRKPAIFAPSSEAVPFPSESHHSANPLEPTSFASPELSPEPAFTTTDSPAIHPQSALATPAETENHSEPHLHNLQKSPSAAVSHPVKPASDHQGKWLEQGLGSAIRLDRVPRVLMGNEWNG